MSVRVVSWIVCEKLKFIAAVRQGLAELDNADSISIEEVEQELPS